MAGLQGQQKGTQARGACKLAFCDALSRDHQMAALAGRAGNWPSAGAE